MEFNYERHARKGETKMKMKLKQSKTNYIIALILETFR